MKFFAKFNSNDFAGWDIDYEEIEEIADDDNSITRKQDQLGRTRHRLHQTYHVKSHTFRKRNKTETPYKEHRKRTPVEVICDRDSEKQMAPKQRSHRTFHFTSPTICESNNNTKSNRQLHSEEKLTRILPVPRSASTSGKQGDPYRAHDTCCSLIHNFQSLSCSLNGTSKLVHFAKEMLFDEFQKTIDEGKNTTVQASCENTSIKDMEENIKTNGSDGVADFSSANEGNTLHSVEHTLNSRDNAYNCMNVSSSVFLEQSEEENSKNHNWPKRVAPPKYIEPDDLKEPNFIKRQPRESYTSDFHLQRSSSFLEKEDKFLTYVPADENLFISSYKQKFLTTRKEHFPSQQFLSDGCRTSVVSNMQHVKRDNIDRLFRFHLPLSFYHGMEEDWY